MWLKEQKGWLSEADLRALAALDGSECVTADRPGQHWGAAEIYADASEHYSTLCAATVPGGASSNFLPPERLGVPIDFETLAAAGSMLGSGAVIFISDEHDLLEAALNVTRFFRNESCGKCVPCRVGSEKTAKLVEAAGGVSDEGTQLLGELHATLARTSICGLGQVALGPLISLLSGFPDRVRGR
jgi:NADH:ubiquinone oxidoreductase subunit F (NADH-binding)